MQKFQKEISILGLLERLLSINRARFWDTCSIKKRGTLCTLNSCDGFQNPNASSISSSRSLVRRGCLDSILSVGRA